ncbi:hypothetical protein [Trinickia sp. Y13]|uniref:hypothetical protein n=1 Tax=Trinickia sp. Y13 TaxID=2917807 RepID=UPI0024051654|nr:hypothetical protein [Trinickia sp. Y13]MDG0027796.1 hypothetical protein [Trinickia sp. Y13]
MRRVTRIAACFGGATAGVVGIAAALALLGALSASGAMAAGDAASLPSAAGASGAATGENDPPVVQWRLEVVRDGQTIDTFESATTLGQGFSATHHHEVTHRVGCKENPAGGIDLARTISISPVEADLSGVTLSIEANETIEDDTAPSTPEGCALPPQPRRVSASHPGLFIPIGEWAAWTLIDKNPTLVYRVRARVTSH